MVGLLLQISLYLFFFFSKFKTKMLADNHPIVRAKTRFGDVEKYIKFVLEIITLLSSANNIGSAREFICNGRLLI